MIKTADLTSRARELEASGKLAEAIDLYREALESEDGEGVSASAPFLLTHIADLHRRKGDDARAFDFFRRAGERYTEQGLLSNAIAVWSRVRENYPDRPEPYLALTRLHRRVGLDEEAASDLEAYLDLAREAGRVEDAKHELRILLARHPAPGLCRVAARFLGEVDGREAVEDVFQEAAVRREEDGGSGDRLLEWLSGWTFPGLPTDGAGGEIGGSAEDGDQPGAPPAGNGDVPSPADVPDSAEDLGAGAELRRGLDLLDELLELEPGNVELRRRKVRYAERIDDPDLLHESYLELAAALADEGEERAARLLYERVLEEEPGNARARARLNQLESEVLEARQRRGGGRSEPAEEGEVELDEQQQAAREELSRRLWREFEASLNELPWLHAATRAFQSVGTGRPPPVTAFEMLGHYLVAQDKPQEAAEVLTAGLGVAEGGDEAADLLYHLVVVHRKLGDDEEAARHLERLAELDEEVGALLANTRLGREVEA